MTDERSTFDKLWWAKLTGRVELHVHLKRGGGLARQVYRQIRTAILDGRLRRGDRLPPTRELAGRLDVSRNTVGLAYEWLVSEGLLAGRRGAGTFVEADPVARLAALQDMPRSGRPPDFSPVGAAHGRRRRLPRR